MGFELKQLRSFQLLFYCKIPTMGAGASAGSKKEQIQEAFKALDKDADGKVTKDELKKVLQDTDAEAFTDEVCDALYVDATKDDDGAITVKEFLAWVEKEEKAEEEKKEE